MTTFIYDIDDTWDDAGTTFRAFQISVTDTASAADSKLFQFNVDASEVASLSKTGGLTLSDDLDVQGSSVILDSDGDTFIDSETDDEYQITVGGILRRSIGATHTWRDSAGGVVMALDNNYLTVNHGFALDSAATAVNKTTREKFNVYDTAVDTLSDLEALTADDYRVVHVLGRASSDDDGGGLWGWLSGDQSSLLRDSAITLSYTSGNIYDAVGHGLLQGEKVIANQTDGGLTANTEYWVERVDADSFKLHTSLLSVYDDSGLVSGASISGALTVQRLRDPGKALYAAPSSDTTGASGVWRRLVDPQLVNFLWAGDTSNTTLRSEAMQNAINALDNGGQVFVPAGNHAFNAPIRVSRSDITIRGMQNGESILNCQSNSDDDGIIFAHPDADTSQSSIGRVALEDVTVFGNNNFNAVRFDNCSMYVRKINITGGFYCILMRGCQLSSLENFSLTSFCDTPGAACLRIEQKEINGGSDFRYAYTTRILNSQLFGDSATGDIATIDNISRANPAVVTTTAAHGLSTGDEVWLRGVSGAGSEWEDEIDRHAFRITVIDSTSFSLQDPYDGTTDIDTSGFANPENSSSATVRQINRVDYLLSVNRADGLEVDNLYWGSCRTAFVHLDPSRVSPGSGASGVSGVRFSNAYWDGVDFFGTDSYRSPKHIVWAEDNGVAGANVGAIHFTNCHFPNLRSPSSREVFRVDGESSYWHFSNCRFSNCNRELFYVDSGGTTSGYFLFSGCIFENGGLDGYPMSYFKDVNTIVMDTSCVFFNSVTGQPRIKLDGTIGRYGINATFIGSRDDIDRSSASVSTRQVLTFSEAGSAEPHTIWTSTPLNLIGQGSAAEPRFVITSDLDTGIYAVSTSNEWGFSAGGSKVAGFDTTGLNAVQLDVDNIRINSSTISAPNNTNINLTPNSGYKTVIGDFGTPHNATVADDGVWTRSLPLSAGQFCIVRIMSYSALGFGDVHIRQDGNCTKLSGSLSTTNNTVLTGTTGSDPAVTVSWNNGNLYVENRTGAGANFRLWVYGPY
jgi:hypothetical protein